LRCRATARFTPEQIAYFETFTGFSATHPTAAEFMQWQDKHPFPK
jgi:hypothetical protein